MSEDFTGQQVGLTYQKVLHRGDDGRLYDGVGNVIYDYDLKPTDTVLIYNISGDLIEKQVNGESTQFIYNTNGTLSAIIYPDYSKVFTYDANNNIILIDIR